MKKTLTASSIALLLAMPLLSGCAQGAQHEPTETPAITKAEVCDSIDLSRSRLSGYGTAPGIFSVLGEDAAKAEALAKEAGEERLAEYLGDIVTATDAVSFPAAQSEVDAVKDALSAARSECARD